MPAVSTKPNLGHVWKRFKATGDRRLRNLLMESYLPIVRCNAERLGARLPEEVDHEDLVSAGIFGLVDAIDSFDIHRGVKFETYCAPRIRGAILDELRTLDWVPRLVRSRSAKLEEASRLLEAELGRRPSQEELAQRLRLPSDEVDRFLRESTTATFVSLSRKHYETDTSKDVCEIDMLEDKRGEDPVLQTHKKDLKALVTRGLSRAERLVLILYYYEGMTMKEIGTVLDLSESRVSQIHSAVLERLKAAFAVREDLATETLAGGRPRVFVSSRTTPCAD